MSDPWLTLILDRHTATERDVKAAYARLLKQHRPDIDPVGFQRVRAAYAEALDWLKHRAHHEEQTELEDTESSPEPPAPSLNTAEEASPANLAPEPEIGAASSIEPLSLPDVEPPEVAPPELAASLAALAQAWQENSREGLATAFAKLSAESLKLQLPALKICRLLHQAVGGKAEPVAQHAPADFLLYLLRGGEVQVVLEVTKSWDSSHSIASAALLAMAMDRAKYQPADEDAAMVLAHLARIIAFHHPGIANQLVNAAYPFLPLDGREQIMSFLEHQIAMGKIFFGFPAEFQRFWKSRLHPRDDEETMDWYSAEAVEALRYVVQNRGHSWEGLGVIQQLVPSEVWEPAEKVLRAQAAKAQKQQQSARGGSKGFQGWMWVIIILVANLGRMLSHDSSSTTPPKSPRTTAEQPSTGLGKKAPIVPSTAPRQQAVPLVQPTVPTLQPTLKLAPPGAPPTPLIIPRSPETGIPVPMRELLR